MQEVANFDDRSDGKGHLVDPQGLFSMIVLQFTLRLHIWGRGKGRSRLQTLDAMGEMNHKPYIGVVQKGAGVKVRYDMPQ